MKPLSPAALALFRLHIERRGDIVVDDSNRETYRELASRRGYDRRQQLRQGAGQRVPRDQAGVRAESRAFSRRREAG